jgi:hypothetical protein
MTIELRSRDDLLVYSSTRATCRADALREAADRCVDTSFLNLRYTDLRGADLSGLNLSHADLTGALLTDANLRGTKLAGALLIGTKGAIGGGHPDCWPAFAYKRHREVFVRVGCRQFTIADAKRHWRGKAQRAEVRAFVAYVERVAKARGWIKPKRKGGR